MARGGAREQDQCEARHAEHPAPDVERERGDDRADRASLAVAVVPDRRRIPRERPIGALEARVGRGREAGRHEALLDDSGVGPVTTSTFSLLMLLGTQGRQFTYAELAKLLLDAGFDDVAATPSYGYYSVVTATRR